MRSVLAVTGLLAGLGVCTGAAAAPAGVPIHKCQVGDRQVYQQDPCHGAGVSGTVLAPDATGTLVPQSLALPPPARRAAASAPAPAAAAPAAPLILRPQDERLERQADACLAWYRPMLKQALSARRTTLPKQEGGTVFLKIDVSDGLGGFDSKVAACEFDPAGRLDPARTTAHAQQRGWKPAP